jgi:2-polyprenyl-3-methyl-5-hydroxy-6-metoxy-1,4-benzoquinol methylase
MLQLRSINRSILDDPSFQQSMIPPAARGEALERHVDTVMTSMRTERRRRARATGKLAQLGAALDAALRTEAVEHMDEEGFPEKGKLGIALGLHMMNVASASYQRFFAELLPLIRNIEARHGRPARILELASGAGGFAFALDALARRRGVRVEVTASDIVPLYVTRGQERAAREGVPLTFRLIDALDMQALGDGSYDIVFIAQSVHHFSPGKLARMIAESRRVATTAFVSVDGYRSLGMVAFVSGTAIMSLWPAMVHDAVISVRKFYGEAELEAIARMAAPDAKVALGRIRPLNTVLSVRFDGAGA